jgi:hypothetical protein
VPRPLNVQTSFGFGEPIELRLSLFARPWTLDSSFKLAVVRVTEDDRAAAAAGFRALYLGGGSLGYVKCVTEANLTLPEMVQLGIDIRTVCPLPLILDGACGARDGFTRPGDFEGAAR